MSTTHLRSIFHGRFIRPLILILAVVTSLRLCTAADSVKKRTSNSGSSAAEDDGQPIYRSKHFVVHTDLPEAEAKALLKRLESTLSTISRYWGRKPWGVIECFVVKDLAKWKGVEFPHSFARTLIRGVGGGTFPDLTTTNGQTRRKATVYCSARPGIAEHEAVHAYCVQTYSDLGPDWYREGMAQMAYYQRRGERGVNCEKAAIRFLRKGADKKTVASVVEGGRINERMAKSINDAAKPGSSLATANKPKDWILAFRESVQFSKREYRWGWSLCHLLSQNPNYAVRFRTLGLGYLNRQQQSFQQLFGPMQKEIDFEYRFFLNRIDAGYRVDLCAWDWKTRFAPLESKQSIPVHVVAKRGYQASGIQVRKGETYSFCAKGTWRTAADRDASNANGDSEGRGRLMGVVMTDYSLGIPFEMACEGTFTVRDNGNLYLRCGDAWNELEDNTGRVTVSIEREENQATRR